MIAQHILAAVEAALPAFNAPGLSRSEIHKRLVDPTHALNHTVGCLRELVARGRATTIPSETRFSSGLPVRLYRRAPAAALSAPET